MWELPEGCCALGASFSFLLTTPMQPCGSGAQGLLTEWAFQIQEGNRKRKGNLSQSLWVTQLWVVSSAARASTSSRHWA